jgi:two-component system, chemotaxis family, sensor kinase CheA
VSAQPGFLGQGIIAGRAARVIDAPGLLRQIAAETDASTPISQLRRRVLVVEDSGFLCNTLISALSSSGFQVRAVNSAARALLLRDAGLPFDAIICDLNIPDMTGIEFLNQVRCGQGDQALWAGLPVIGLSRDHAEIEAPLSGFSEVVVNPDSSRVLAALETCLSDHISA